jgi:hypothetical protein
MLQHTSRFLFKTGEFLQLLGILIAEDSYLTSFLVMFSGKRHLSYSRVYPSVREAQIQRLVHIGGEPGLHASIRDTFEKPYNF